MKKFCMYENFLQVDVATTRLMFEVFKRRPDLQPFNDKDIISFSLFEFHDADEEMEQKRQTDLVKQLLFGISRSMVEPKMTSRIQDLVIDKVYLDNEGCQALAEAFGSKTLMSVKVLDFILDGRVCMLESVAALGKVCHSHFLPCLKGLSVGMSSDKSGDGLTPLQCWKAFFCAIPVGGLTQIEKFLAGSPDEFSGSVGSIFSAIARVKGRDSAILKGVLSLRTWGVIGGEDLLAITASLFSGCFPRLQSLSFGGKS